MNQESRKSLPDNVDDIFRGDRTSIAVETTDDTAEPGGAETNTMGKKTLAFIVAALALLAGLHQASAQGPEGEQTEPFLCSQDFESGTDPVVFWTSYKKKCTVSFKRPCPTTGCFRREVLLASP